MLHVVTSVCVYGIALISFLHAYSTRHTSCAIHPDAAHAGQVTTRKKTATKRQPSKHVLMYEYAAHDRRSRKSALIITGIAIASLLGAPNPADSPSAQPRCHVRR